ncbi:MAG TPA: nuclear transport factor 2 family protein [Acidimicrobiales bacterium]|jgi:hypothetical protein
MDRALVTSALDLLAIDRLQRRYGDVITRRAWPELAELFTPEAPIRIDTRTRPLIEVRGPGELAAFVEPSIERFRFFEFTILNTVADLDTDGPDDIDDPDGPAAATGRVYLCEVRFDPDAEGWSQAYGVYHDTYARTDGRWWIAGRRYHSLGRRGVEDAAFPFPTAADLAR